VRPLADSPSEPSAPVVWESPERIEGPAPGVEFAPHGGRLVAYIIDSLILTVACSITGIAAAVVLASGTTVEGQTVTNVEAGASAGFFLLLLLTLVIGIGYFPYFWSHGGQTPGMRPFSLYVVRDRDGSSIGWGTALLRLVGLWVAAVVFYIGYIWVFVDKRRRGWQDLIAGTIVVKRP
jgi:uncharacterized RDD family membrane protein YckC